MTIIKQKPYCSEGDPQLIDMVPKSEPPTWYLDFLRRRRDAILKSISKKEEYPCCKV